MRAVQREHFRNPFLEKRSMFLKIRNFLFCLSIPFCVFASAGALAAPDMAAQPSLPSEKPTAAEKVPEGLEERVLGYWHAKIDGRAETAYGYVSPTMRKMLTYKHFLRQMKGVGRWRSVSFHDAKCHGDRCDVTVVVEIYMRMPPFPKPIHTSAPVTEKWFRKNGEWWILLDH
jgi:hypothetical protein